jgi:repressor LexA
MDASGNRVAEARVKAGMTQQQLADALGVTQQSVQYYEYGKRDIKGSLIVRMCDILGCSAAFLLGMDNGDIVEPSPADCYVPMVGRIAAGTPTEAIEFSDERGWVSPSVVEKHPNSFLLEVHGDSMNLRYPDGSMVLIDPDDTNIKSGKVYAVLVNGCDATLKQVFLAGDTIVLHPLSSNSAHKDRTIDVTDPDAPFFSIVGRAVWFVGREE